MENYTKVEKKEDILNSNDIEKQQLMEKLGFQRTGEKISTYYDENNNILTCYTYECDKAMFNNH